MNDMGRCGVFFGDERIGSAVWVMDADTVKISASCPAEDGMIYRATLSWHGGEMKLGVMMPSGGKFVVNRSVPRREARALTDATADSVRCAVTKNLPGEAPRDWPLPFDYSELRAVCENDVIGDLLFKSAVINGSARCAEREGRLYIVFPLSGEKASPFAPFFCMAQAVERKGELYGVITVDRHGRLE